jgi:tripartite-type tricarboxylate transporter receptor subunit TctC
LVVDLGARPEEVVADGQDAQACRQARSRRRARPNEEEEFMMRRILRLATILLVLALSGAAFGQYPTKPIRLVVPFPSGSATDTVARILAAPVGQALGQTIVVENRAGADGLIAGQEVAKSPPDGYTLLLGTNSPMSAVPAMKKAVPYDVMADFTPITDVGRFTHFLCVNADLPVKTLPELIAYAKQNPGKLNYATGNTAGIVAFAQILALSETKMLQVPYKGEPAAMVDLLAGRVQLMIATPTTALPHIQSGKLRALGLTLSRRSPLLPEVPPIAEGGLPQFSIVSWAALFGPAKMPRDIVMTLNREFGAAMKRPDVIAALEKQAFPLNASTPEELAAFTKEQLDGYARILRAAGVQPE